MHWLPPLQSIPAFGISFSKTSSLLRNKTTCINYIKVFPFHSATPYCRSRVTPLTSSTIAFRCSSKRLKNVLLPTFGLPTIATVNTHNFNSKVCNLFQDFITMNFMLQINVTCSHSFNISVFLQLHIILSPLRSHFHKQFQKYFLLQKFFNIFSCILFQFS